MSIIGRLRLNSKAFIVDYCGRHRHPLNACLHIVGVPLVLVGVAKVFTGKAFLGSFFFIFGYFLQYLGHKAQGNEVGEVTLFKKIWRLLAQRKGQ